MIVLILLLGFLLRLINLNQSLWLDEAITALAVRDNTLWEITTKYSPGDFHPPLYYLVVKTWANIFGYSEISLRMPSVIFGTLTILFVFLIGKKLWSKKVGIVAGLFLALNPLAVYYSQEARMYSLETLLVSASVWAFIKEKWLWFVIFFSLALYSDYLPVFLVPVFFVFAHKRRIAALIPIILLTPMATLVLSQLFVATRSLQNIPGWAMVLGAFDFKSAPLTFVKFIIGRISLDNKYLYGGLMTVVCAVYIFILSKAKQKLVWAWLVIPVSIGILVSLKIPIYSYFRFLFVVPAFTLLLAKGGGKNRFLILFVAFISIFSLMIFNSSPRFLREDWRALAGAVREDGSQILMPSLAQSAPLKYYRVESPRILDVQTARPNLLYGPQIHLLRYVQEIFDKDDTLVSLLETSGFHKVSEKTYNGLVEWTYERTSQ